MTVYLGCNIYFWGEREQDRLLVECARPLAEGLRAEGKGRCLSCVRFDARGPHVMALLGVTPAGHEEVSARVSAAVAAYLARCPSGVSSSRAEIQARHVACRGKTLCHVDGEPDLAENNTYRLFNHTDRQYPFNLADGVVEQDELWRLREEVVLWALGQLDTGSPRRGTAAAIRWISALDRALRAAGEPPEEHWEYMTGRVLFGMKELASAEEPVSARLLSIVGEKNCRTLSRAWRAPSPHPESSVDLGPIVRVILAEDGRPREQRLALLRDLVHTTLMLLGLTVRAQVPILLFAWAASASGDAPSGGRP